MSRDQMFAAASYSCGQGDPKINSQCKQESGSATYLCDARSTKTKPTDPKKGAECMKNAPCKGTVGGHSVVGNCDTGLCCHTDTVDGQTPKGLPSQQIPPQGQSGGSPSMPQLPSLPSGSGSGGSPSPQQPVSRTSVQGSQIGQPLTTYFQNQDRTPVSQSDPLFPNQGMQSGEPLKTYFQEQSDALSGSSPEKDQGANLNLSSQVPGPSESYQMPGATYENPNGRETIRETIMQSSAMPLGSVPGTSNGVSPYNLLSPTPVANQGGFVPYTGFYSQSNTYTAPPVQNWWSNITGYFNNLFRF